MEIGRWKRRRYVPEWGENKTEEDPVVVVFAPPTVGWMARWRELALSVPRVGDDLEAEAKSDRLLERLTVWTSEVKEYRTEFFSTHLLAVESLTLDGKAVSLEDAVAFIEENEGLREEIFQAVLAEGAVTRQQGKG